MHLLSTVWVILPYLPKNPNKNKTKHITITVGSEFESTPVDLIFHMVEAWVHFPGTHDPTTPQEPIPENKDKLGAQLMWLSKPKQ